LPITIVIKGSNDWVEQHALEWLKQEHTLVVSGRGFRIEEVIGSGEHLQPLKVDVQCSNALVNYDPDGTPRQDRCELNEGHGGSCTEVPQMPCTVVKRRTASNGAVMVYQCTQRHGHSGEHTLHKLRPTV
jgi:hypothetical protein